jgi:GH35 family endo-1,4-beta-xylanase
MLLTRRLQQPRPPQSAPPDPLDNVVPPRVHAWVLVNEAFDSTHSPKDIEFWSGRRCTKHDIDQARADLVARLLRVAHGVDPTGLLLVNDFYAEFYPPPRSTHPRAQAKAVAALQREYAKASVFYRMMSQVMRKDGALRGRVGVGYQMHFPYGDRYHAAKSVYRAALLRGIRMYKRLGVPVVITEMVVQRNGFPDDLATYNSRTYSKDPTHPSWQENAAVYRDIIRTYYSEEGCNSVSFWGLYDEPADEKGDWYGHLYDAGPAIDTGIVNPDGTHVYAFTGSTLHPKPSYFGVLNGIIDAVCARRGPKAVPNWLRRFAPD